MIRQTLFTISALAILLMPLTAFAQDFQEMTPEEQQKAWQDFMVLASPSTSHEYLEPMVGSWKTTTSIWMAGPDSDPTMSTGTSEKVWILDGRFVQEHLKGSMMGMPFEGQGMVGFNNYKNIYISSWCDNMSTQILSANGMRHPETGVFTFYGLMDEPMLKVHDRTVKHTYTIESPDRHVFTVFDLHAGDDYKAFEIVYERVK